ncbi:rhamnogalacturonyl hydrolase YesR [Lewinella aquimaris]|uniref:Rhamnogalacturonyl hydrolase YesR n=1 Tax=Neolewinella aquimaris TaxID=1835722 RepID=A0A840E1Z1_9BACT|nr:glycoside hydrolase family 88 protein [Neolewinella aquimaris]MBB4079241.1 rhamnogalacturonyl hydrolase YesR [Neolewinella aquimaris]
MRISIIITGLLLTLLVSCRSVPELKPDAIENKMVAALKWQEANPIQAKAPTDWTNGAYYTGVARAHDATDNAVFLQALKDMGERNAWQTYERTYHADDVAISYAYLYLDEKQPNVVDLEPTEAFLDAHLNAPHEWRAGTRNDEKTILWWWCDALFMAPPVIAEYATRYPDSDRDALLDTMYTYYRETYDMLYDQDEHLFARDGRYLWTGSTDDRKEANGKKIFWSRGNGWVMGGLALILDELPADYEHRPFFLDLYREMAAKVKAIQPEDGLWRTSLLSPESFDHGEVSGSGFYTFALAWGINNGILDRGEYLPVVTKAWKGLTEAQQASGKVGWVQDIGADPQPASADSWQNFGTGAFLLAGSEVLKLKQ